VGYNILVADKGMTDPQLIAWMKERGAVWVHADDSAKRAHKKLLTDADLRILWVHRPKGAMSAKDQLRILAYVLQSLLQLYQQYPARRRYRVSDSGPSPGRIRIDQFEL
jgi:hypothetical protein